MPTRYVYSGASSTYDGTSFATAYRSLAEADSNITAGDTILVAKDHNYNHGGSITVTIPNSCRIISVDRTTEDYAVATSNGDYTDSGTYTFAGAEDISVLVEGIEFGTTASSTCTPGGGDASQWTFRECILNSGGGYGVVPSDSCRYTFLDCTIDSQSSTSGSVVTLWGGGSLVTFRNLTAVNHTSKDEWFGAYSDVSSGRLLVTDSDLSGIQDLCDSPDIWDMIFERCKLHASYIFCGGANVITGRIILLNSGPGTTLSTTPSGLVKAQIGTAGSIEHTNSTYLNASDGENDYSLKYTTLSTVSITNPLEAPIPFAIWHDASESKTLTVQLNSGDSGLEDDDVYAIVSYGDADAGTSYQGTFVDTRPGYGSEAAAGTSTYLKTATESWFGAGGTDYKIEVTGINPVEPGFVYVRIGLTKHLSATNLWVDPAITLT